MPRPPQGKRMVGVDGSVAVVSKNPNGEGSVYFAAPSRRANGTIIAGRWAATFVDADGRRRSVNGATRAKAEACRAEVLAEFATCPLTHSRFSRSTTVEELATWWLDSVARHQVKASTFDSYRKFTGYLVADIGKLPVTEVGPELLTEWQSKLLDRFAPFTVLNCRKVCRQAFAEAVKVGLLRSNPFEFVRAPRGRP